MTQACKILLADDHKVVLQGISHILDTPEFEIVGTVRNGRALVDAARELKPDVILADISMPLLNGIEAARQIRTHHPRAKIIFLTMHPEAIYAVEAMKAGASGYLVKNIEDEELIAAVRRVRDGGIYITPSLEEPVLNALHAPRKSARGVADALTARQREVLQLLAEGRQPKEIAAILKVSYRTVEFHKYRIMETLGIRTVPALAAYAAKFRIVA
jgi:DNA-binding NarL/FixJ family response regulator